MPWHKCDNFITKGWARNAIVMPWHKCDNFITNRRLVMQLSCLHQHQAWQLHYEPTYS